MSLTTLVRSLSATFVRSTRSRQAAFFARAKPLHVRPVHHHSPISSATSPAASAVAQEAAAAAQEEEHVGIYGTCGILGAIVGANALAIWCEFQMTPDQSLLQGLATLKNTKPKPQDEDIESPYTRRRTTKFRISIHYS
jgi:hypothetical protein